MAEVFEFMTGWDEADNGFRPTVWAKREIADLQATARSNRGIAKFKPFDMLGQPNAEQLLFSNDDQRISVESVVGTQPTFTRNVDFDLLLLQFSGTSVIETEFGTVELNPAELLLIPGGIAHRSTGSADCLRTAVKLAQPVATIYGDDKHRGETAFSVGRQGGPSWDVPPTLPATGQVLEKMISWYDRPGDFTEVERDASKLVGIASAKRNAQESLLKKLRIFDVFWEITGQGKGPGPKIIGSPCFMMDVYNTRGHQHAYHRALRTDEFGMHFRGRSYNMSELEDRTELLPGDFFMVPRGIAHRVEALDDEFLRVVFYATKPWTVGFTGADQKFDSKFDVTTKLVKPAEWMAAAE